MLRPTRGTRLLAAALAASLTGCAGAPRVTIAPPPEPEPLAATAGQRAATELQPPPPPKPYGRLKVAVLPFDNKSGTAEPVGETAAALFTQELLKFPSYRVLGQTASERTVKVESSVETDTRGGKGRKETVQVLATEKGLDPIEWGRTQGVDAVLTGSVTEYRHRQGFIFPPARVGIEARLIHIPTRQVLWSASDLRGYPAWRWLAFIAWPLGAALAFFSPPADARLKQSVEKTAARVREQLDAARRQIASPST